MLRHDQVVLEVDVPAELPLVDCHSQQIQQVLMNLVTNARDALNERYPGYDDDKRIIVACRAVDHEGRPGVCLTVEDHGLGISEEIAGRILDPFYTTKAGELGTGLGLSISHGIVQEHQGRLWYETRAGHWTKFHVDLPVNHRTE